MLRPGSARRRLEETERDQFLGRVAFDAAAHQIEDVLFVDRTDRGAVKRFDVVGRDLERRDRIDLRVFADQQRVVAQRGLGAVRVRRDADVAEVAAAAATGGDAAHDGLRGRVRHVVLHFGRQLHVFARDREEERGDFLFAPGPCLLDDDLVGHRAAAEQRDVPARGRRRRRASSRVASVRHRGADVLQDGIRYASAFRQRNCGGHRDFAIGVAVSALDDRRARARADRDERVRQQRGSATS